MHILIFTTTNMMYASTNYTLQNGQSIVGQTDTEEKILTFHDIIMDYLDQLYIETSGLPQETCLYKFENKFEDYFAGDTHPEIKSFIYKKFKLLDKKNSNFSAEAFEIFKKKLFAYNYFLEEIKNSIQNQKNEIENERIQINFLSFVKGFMLNMAIGYRFLKHTNNIVLTDFSKSFNMISDEDRSKKNIIDYYIKLQLLDKIRHILKISIKITSKYGLSKTNELLKDNLVNATNYRSKISETIRYFGNICGIEEYLNSLDKPLKDNTFLHFIRNNINHESFLLKQRWLYTLTPRYFNYLRKFKDHKKSDFLDIWRLSRPNARKLDLSYDNQEFNLSVYDFIKRTNSELDNPFGIFVKDEFTKIVIQRDIEIFLIKIAFIYGLHMHINKGLTRILEAHRETLLLFKRLHKILFSLLKISEKLNFISIKTIIENNIEILDSAFIFNNPNTAAA